MYTDNRQSGWLAQLVERLPYKQDVGGSNPSSPTKLEIRLEETEILVRDAEGEVQ